MTDGVIDLAGRTALITGGGGGLGADLAKRFAASGAMVWVTGRSADRVAAVAHGHPNISALTCDVTDEASVIQAFDRIGRAEVVIANAGAADTAPLAKTGLDQFRAMLDVNLTGVFLTLREGLRRLEGAGWGRLIAVASTAGLKGYRYTAGYTAAKHGAVGLIRTAALEVAKTGITANALCPGFLDTEMTQTSIRTVMDRTGRSAEQALAGLTAANPQGRLIQPEEVSRAALWLCGPGSAAVNGQAIAISGGEI